MKTKVSLSRAVERYKETQRALREELERLRNEKRPPEGETSEGQGEGQGEAES